MTWSALAPTLMITSVTIPFPPLLLDEPLPDIDALDETLPPLEDNTVALELTPPLDAPTELDAPVEPDPAEDAPLDDAAEDAAADEDDLEDDVVDAPDEEEEPPPHSHGVKPVRSALQFCRPMKPPTHKHPLWRPGASHTTRSVAQAPSTPHTLPGSQSSSTSHLETNVNGSAQPDQATPITSNTTKRIMASFTASPPRPPTWPPRHPPTQT